MFRFAPIFSALSSFHLLFLCSIGLFTRNLFQFCESVRAALTSSYFGLYISISKKYARRTVQSVTHLFIGYISDSVWHVSKNTLISISVGNPT